MTLSTTENELPVVRPQFPAGSASIVKNPLRQIELLSELQGLADFFFPGTVDHYSAMEADEFRQIALAAQDEANRRDFARRIASDQRETICALLNTDTPLIQSNLYFRAVRPRIAGGSDNIGWHRESFYGPDMEESLNLWMPVANVTATNAMQYIPDSHTIPDQDIKTVSIADPTVQRFSAGHKLGLLYAPKQIVSGVDLDSAVPLVVLPGEAAIFSGAMIHGAAENRSDKLRFSVDFRLVAQESLREGKDHFASGKSYFEPI